MSACLSAQISPGDLTKAHAHLEGLSNCTKCHTLGEQVTNGKCLSCHQEIGRRTAQGKGYHSSQAVKGKECRQCHSEHHGRNFAIIKFDKNNFRHTLTGFELTGKHSEIQCNECHKKENIKEPEAKKRKNTWLGLEGSCISCHEDYHLTALGNDCRLCHSTERFSPAPYFNHDKARFSLTGAHQRVKCRECHSPEKRNGKDFQKFTSLNFRNCVPCHKDVHEGRFGQDCRKCHSTSGFKNIAVSSFDHSKTRFPLLGMHKNVSCTACHKSGLSQKPPFEKCISCHIDYHEGDFGGGANRKDCAVCHTVEGFTPSLFTVEEHNKSRFPLTGGHLAVPCRSCHTGNGEKTKKWHFRIESSNCTDCHENVHGSELGDNYSKGSGCEKCHSTSSWRTVKFDHEVTGFRLEGKHASTGCRACHYKTEGDKAGYVFSSLKDNCTACHNDTHAGQFGKDVKEDCLRCHQFENWKPVRFNHSNTRFTLEGGHKNVPCERCHYTDTFEGRKFVKYKLENFRCSDCHR